ncbi:MAG: hypothetical protein WDN46_05130 [Methylocella sp.]
MPAENPKPKKAVDWEAIEREYRAGQLSVSEIGRLYGVSHTAINKRAKKDGWQRDLAERVRREVSARLVSEGVSASNARETIELAAERDIQLVREHRKDIGNGRKLVAALFDELKQVSENRDEIEDLIEADAAHSGPKGEIDFKRRNMMLRAVSLGGRATAVASLSIAMRNLVGLERQAFNLPDKADPGDGGGSVEFKTIYESRPRD